MIVHELTDTRRTLLRERAIDAVIDQNPTLEAQVAVETIARLLGRMEGESGSTFTDIRIHMPENAEFSRRQFRHLFRLWSVRSSGPAIL